jgi:hypothetical protein
VVEVAGAVKIISEGVDFFCLTWTGRKATFASDSILYSIYYTSSKKHTPSDRQSSLDLFSSVSGYFLVSLDTFPPSPDASRVSGYFRLIRRLPLFLYPSASSNFFLLAPSASSFSRRRSKAHRRPLSHGTIAVGSSDFGSSVSLLPCALCPSVAWWGRRKVVGKEKRYRWKMALPQRRSGEQLAMEWDAQRRR